MTNFPAGTKVRVKDNYPVTNTDPDPLDEDMRGKVHKVSEFTGLYYRTQPEGSDPLPYDHLFLPEELEAV